MTESRRAIATDLKALDAHVIKPHEYEDAPELTDGQLAEADLHEGGKLIRRGRPPSENRKQPVKFRLDADLVAALRASGPGWQTRVNALVREAVLGAKAALAKAKRNVSPPPPKWLRPAIKPAVRLKKALKKKARA